MMKKEQNKFDDEERAAGKTCYILGASFITEGAIPFAASDPLRVLPSCMIGAGIAGGLSQCYLEFYYQHHTEDCL